MKYGMNLLLWTGEMNDSIHGIRLENGVQSIVVEYVNLVECQ